MALMRQLRLRPEGFLSWAYVLESREGQVLGRVRLGWFGEKGGIRLGAKKVVIKRESLWAENGPSPRTHPSKPASPLSCRVSLSSCKAAGACP